MKIFQNAIAFNLEKNCISTIIAIRTYERTTMRLCAENVRRNEENDGRIVGRVYKRQEKDRKKMCSW